MLAAALMLGLAAIVNTAIARDTPGDTTLVAEATVPADRLAEQYAGLAGSEDAAADIISGLRTGDDFTFAETVIATNPDGSTSTTTVEHMIVNPNGVMGYGEINITLALAQNLIDSGEYPDLQSALTGSGTTDTDGILQMRADGMGWGKIAKTLGLNLGEVVSASKTEHAHAGDGKSKPDRVARTERSAKPERPGKLERPERAERPSRPERGGGRP